MRFLAGLKSSLIVLHDAKIDALDSSLHCYLQEAALYRDLKLTGAALWLMDSIFFSSLRSFVKKSFQETDRPSEATQISDTEVVADVINKAENLYSLLYIWDLKRLKKWDLNVITNFLVWVVYECTISWYHQSHIAMLKSQCQPVREALTLLIPFLRSPSSSMIPNELIDWVGGFEDALPQTLEIFELWR